MKHLFFLSFLACITINSFSQESLAYDCKKLDDEIVKINITQALKPLDYQGKKVYIIQYELTVGIESIAKFFTYKFNNKLYILDGSVTKINHSKDQVLFDLPQQNYYPVRLSGNMSNMDMMLEKFYSINDEDFYIYKPGRPSTTPYEISKLIFDKRLNISEIEIKSKTSSCTCTKKRIIIKLK